jgi:uncharacterized protein YjaZ
MKFKVVDTESAYRRLLTTPDAETRNEIFDKELVEPFVGLVKFFGGDGMTAFMQWGMSPAQFADDKRERTAAIIDALAAADAWNRAAQALDKGYAAFAKYADRIALDDIIFGLYIADMGDLPGQYTGFGGIPGWIMTVYGKPDERNLRCVEAATVHELHHNLGGAANAVFGKDMNAVTVGEYMIGEGLAESFAAELYGEDKIGPWVTDFDESRLEETRQLMKDALEVSGFDKVRGYIFGDITTANMSLPKTGVPAYAGYAIGYRIVQKYLKRSGKGVVDATFVPAREVIRESGFFV